MGYTVAFVRGINVGGKRRLPMQALREALTADGLAPVRTHLQSGNVVVPTPPDGDLALLETRLERVVAGAFALDVAVLCRSADELGEIAGRHPQLVTEPDLKNLHVAFLRAEPDPELVAQLDPDRSPPDQFAVIGREVYLHYPGGAARTKLSGAYFERVLDATATARNLNTVTRLQQMTGQD